jgi:hypothetical protein
MKGINLKTIFFLTAMLAAVVSVNAPTDTGAQSKEPKANEALKSKSEVANLPETPWPIHYGRGYQLVTEVLDIFGGESESDTYRIPFNSAGQPSAVSISEGDSFMVKAGFVHASFVLRGDVNADETVGAGDIVCLINYLFRSAADPCPLEAGDANCDGGITAGDVIYLISYLFREGPPPES